MGIGTGIVLIVIGLILLFAFNGDIPFFTDGTLGAILIGAGVVVIILVLVVNAQRGRRTTTRRPQDPPVL